MSQPKTLHLALKKKWFDMILSGEKKEEYRDKKTYWCRILCEGFSEAEKNGKAYFSYPQKDFDFIHFTNGYGAHRPQIIVECMGISLDSGKVEWGFDGQEKCFVISLGKIIETKNIK